MSKDTKPEVIKRSWEALAKLVLPNPCPYHQHLEMKRCFYSGFYSAIGTLTDLKETTSEEELSELVTNLMLECMIFFNESIPRNIHSRNLM